MIRMLAVLAVAGVVAARPAAADVTVRCSYQNHMILFQPSVLNGTLPGDTIRWTMRRLSYGTGNAPSAEIGRWNGVLKRGQLQQYYGWLATPVVPYGPADISDGMRRYSGDECTALINVQSLPKPFRPGVRPMPRSPRFNPAAAR